jgi:hypothetical protein
MYNIADLIRFNLKRGKDFKEESIVCKYLNQIEQPLYEGKQPGAPSRAPWMPAKAPKINFKLLYDIVNQRKIQPMNEDCFVVHVRAGDIMHQMDRFFKPEMYSDIIKKYNLDKRFKRCMIVTGNHLSGEVAKVKESSEYINKLQKEIEKSSIVCELISGDVDDDFAILATAKCYVAGFRGFAWLAASINPNEVIWDIQNPPEFPWLTNWAYDSHRKDYISQLIEGWEFHRQIQRGK